MRLLTEPLFHFCLAGIALFAVYAWLDHASGTQEASVQRQVRISEGDLRWATETWTRQWQRAPSPQEQRGLLMDLVKEELLAREARELEIDKDDTVVRRRLAQKMTFLIEDVSRLSEPTDEELQKFYDARKDGFSRQPRISFQHVFFDRARRTNAVADAQQVLVKLAGGSAPDAIHSAGDRLLIESTIDGADLNAVSAQFGKDFGRAVFMLPQGAWHGPIESAYGLHLVRVTEIVPAEQRPFREVRDQVLERWREQRRQEARDRYFAELFKKYEIVADDSVETVIGPIDMEAE